MHLSCIYIAATSCAGFPSGRRLKEHNEDVRVRRRSINRFDSSSPCFYVSFAVSRSCDYDCSYGSHCSCNLLVVLHAWGKCALLLGVYSFSLLMCSHWFQRWVPIISDFTCNKVHVHHMLCFYQKVNNVEFKGCIYQST